MATYVFQHQLVIDLTAILDMSRFEVMACSLFYQFTLYVALRLAHRGFTLGELGLVCFGGTALSMELLNLTIARVGDL